MKNYLLPADVCLPDFSKVDGSKWASVACDQYTSEPEYWNAAYKYAKGSPTTLDLMLPEAFLDKEAEMLPKINENMKNYLKDVLVEYKNSMVLLERTQSDGKIRTGIVAKIDLELYDYNKGSTTLVRATEGTVLERIPPRVAIRRGATIEMPHIMILIDDPNKTVIEPIKNNAKNYKVAYDFDLMAGSGHVKGYFVNENDFSLINGALNELASESLVKEKYGVVKSPLLYAVGDGNHSLASAKALYEEIKGQIGLENALNHPARYALCEIVNLHDTALEFEPIYRVVFNVNAVDFINDFKNYANSLKGDIKKQQVEFVYQGKTESFVIESPCAQLTVGTVQNFLDDYVKTNKNANVDYIHGEETVKKLASEENTIGILFDGLTKDMLFKTVMCDGALPRKTFSMGHAEDKRFYLECRKIK